MAASFATLVKREFGTFTFVIAGLLLALMV